MMPSGQSQFGLEGYKCTVKNWRRGVGKMWAQSACGHQLGRVKRNDAVSFIMGNVYNLALPLLGMYFSPSASLSF